MKSFKSILLITLGLLTTACSGTGTGNPLEDGKGRISGKLTTSSSAGATGSVANAASVRVYSSNTVTASTSTNSNGQYSVDVLPGNYEVEFEATGHRKRRHSITVTEGEIITVDDILLSRPAEVIGASVGNLILYAGSDYTTGIVDAYDVVSGTHFTANLSEARRYMATATIGANVYFIGGLKDGSNSSSAVDIYNSSSNTWSTQSLLTTRTVNNVATIGSKLIIGGGYIPSSSNALTSIEIIDTTSWTVTTNTLSTGRHWSATVAVGTKAYFIGGSHCWTFGCENNTIDIYDSVANSISTISMPRYRHHHTAVAVGTKIYIGGGYDENSALLNVVDILETSNNTWTSTTMTTAPGQSAIAGAWGSYIFFAGGNTLALPFSDIISLYNTSTGTWTELSMSQGRYNIGLAIANGKAYLAGGSHPAGGETDLIEVLDISIPSVSIFSKSWF